MIFLPCLLDTMSGRITEWVWQITGVFYILNILSKCLSPMTTASLKQKRKVNATIRWPCNWSACWRQAYWSHRLTWSNFFVIALWKPQNVKWLCYGLLINLSLKPFQNKGILIRSSPIRRVQQQFKKSLFFYIIQKEESSNNFLALTDYMPLAQPGVSDSNLWIKSLFKS